MGQSADKDRNQQSDGEHQQWAHRRILRSPVAGLATVAGIGLAVSFFASGRAFEHVVIAAETKVRILIALVARLEASPAAAAPPAAQPARWIESQSSPPSHAEWPEYRQRGRYLPGISVAPNGRVDVASYDCRNDPFFSPGTVGNMNAALDERYWMCT